MNTVIKYRTRNVHTILNTTTSIMRRTTPAIADTTMIQTAISFLIVLGASGKNVVVV